MKRMMVMVIALVVGCGIRADNWSPQFASSGSSVQYIKMGAPAGGDRCGALTVKPKGGHNVLLQSSIWAGSTESERIISKPADGSNFVQLPVVGVRARFDWGGRSPQTHYRIYCFKRDETSQYPIAVNCSEVVTIEDVLFDRTCGGVARWAGGTGADYGELQMNKG